MKQRLREFLSVPASIRTEFWQDTLQRNRLSLLVISILIFGMELYNMARVLFWSTSGLGTLNNRIYFSLYCALWLAAALSLLLQRLLRRAAVRTQWAVQYGSVLFFLLWHVCLNAYDLVRNPDAEVTIFTTAILGLSVFIQMPGLFSFIAYGAAYGVFLTLAGPLLSEGTRLNLTFTAIVALAVSLTSCRHAVIMILQRQEISQMNLQLQVLLQKDPLTDLLNKTAFEDCVAYQLERLDRRHTIALVMVDLDDFKGINDRYGHPCGDDVLRATARNLQAVFPEAAGIGRVGGDEFAVALWLSDSCEALEADCRRLIGLQSAVRWQEAEALGVRCSIGVCCASRPGLTYDLLYRAADDALYQAKAAGKGRCCLRRLD